MRGIKEIKGGCEVVYITKKITRLRRDEGELVRGTMEWRDKDRIRSGRDCRERSKAEVVWIGIIERNEGELVWWSEEFRGYEEVDIAKKRSKIEVVWTVDRNTNKKRWGRAGQRQHGIEIRRRCEVVDISEKRSKVESMWTGILIGVEGELVEDTMEWRDQKF